MPTATEDCPKDVRRDDLTGWTKSSEQKAERGKKAACDKMWDRSSVTFAKTAKKCAFRWAVNVRAQYEPAKRAVRFFRWHHRPRLENAAARLFYEEAARWKDETMHWSSMTKIISHPSYLRIIGLGREFKEGEIERLILHELENEPYHWFDALTAITGENPVKPEDDFDAAVNAWLEWGRREGIVANDNATRVEG